MPESLPQKPPKSRKRDAFNINPARWTCKKILNRHTLFEMNRTARRARRAASRGGRPTWHIIPSSARLRRQPGRKKYRVHHSPAKHAAFSGISLEIGRIVAQTRPECIIRVCFLPALSKNRSLDPSLCQQAAIVPAGRHHASEPACSSKPAW